MVIEAVEAAAELMGRPAVATRWDEPSALDGMTVGAVRPPGSSCWSDDCVSRSHSPRLEARRRASDPGHLLPRRGRFTDPRKIKDVSATEAAIGYTATLEKCRLLAAEMPDRLAAEPEDRLVGALGGRMLTLDDFCRTRLIEVLLHLDDLASSVGEARPPTNPVGAAIVIDITMNIARKVHGDWEVLYGLTRAERVGERPVFPVF